MSELMLSSVGEVAFFDIFNVYGLVGEVWGRMTVRPRCEFWRERPDSGNESAIIP